MADYKELREEFLSGWVEQGERSARERLDAIYAAVRLEAIEECAGVAEKMEWWHTNKSFPDELRKLK